MLDLLENCTVIRTLYNQEVRTEFMVYPKGILVSDPDPKSQYVPYFAEFYLLPNGQYVPKLRRNAERFALSYRVFEEGQSMIDKATVHEIDPSLDLPFVSFEDGQINWFERNGQVATFSDQYSDFYEKVFFGESYAAESVPVKEDVIPQGAGPAGPEFIYETPYDYLINYLTQTKVDPKVPVLVGHTGVAKSAIVEAAAEANNMRLIDVRCGFISAQDIEGYATILPDDTFEQAPMKELIIATDQFLAQARKFVEDHEGQDLSAEDQKTLEQMKEFSKTPLIFFDEINRTEKSVRNAFTKILNNKKLLNYSMEEAVIVAAANVPIGGGDDFSFEDMVKFYTTEEIRDIATLERFTIIGVDPQSDLVWNGWMDWAQNKRKVPFHENILDFLVRKREYAYDFSSLVGVEDDQGLPVDPSQLTDMKITTFRGWEQLNDYYVENMVDSKEGSIPIIYNILGETKAAKDFVTYLREELGFSLNEAFESDNLSDTLSQGLDNNLPVLMAAPTSVGKTSRVAKYAEDNDAILVEINLALKSRTQIRGIPDPKNFSDSIAEGLEGDLVEELKDAMTVKGLPEELTQFVPDKNLLEQLKTAKETGRDVILFFDEVNRADPIVMSSVFEAVSNHRFMGIDFPKGQLKVVCACNVGEAYGDTGKLDPAFTARFMMARKTDYDKSDYEAFINWAESEGSDGEMHLDPALVEAMKAVGYDTYREMMKTVTQTNMANNVPSTRSLESLSVALTSSSYANSVLQGMFILAEAENIEDVTNEEIEEGLKDSKWVGNQKESSIKLDVGGKIVPVSGQDVIDTWNERQDRDLLVTYELSIRSRRLNIFQSRLGEEDVVEKLLTAYNRAQKNKAIKIKDLINASLMPDYISQEVPQSERQTEEGVKKTTDLTIKVLGEFIWYWSKEGVEDDGEEASWAIEIIKSSYNALPGNKAKSAFIRDFMEEDWSWVSDSDEEFFFPEKVVEYIAEIGEIEGVFDDDEDDEDGDDDDE